MGYKVPTPNRGLEMLKHKMITAFLYTACKQKNSKELIKKQRNTVIAEIPCPPLMAKRLKVQISDQISTLRRRLKESCFPLPFHKLHQEPFNKTFNPQRLNLSCSVGNTTCLWIYWVAPSCVYVTHHLLPLSCQFPSINMNANMSVFLANCDA